MLVLLDVRAAFCTTDHHIILKTFRAAVVRIISDHMSHVEQTSVLGPIHFALCMHSLDNIIRKHGIHVNSYANDTHLYLSM